MPVSISGTNFTNNSVVTEGGAIYNSTSISGSPLTLSNVNFSGNSSTSGNGGAIFNEGGPLAIYGSTFSQNNVPASKFGGAIFSIHDTNIVNTGFSYNSTGSNGKGGAIYSYGGLNLNLVNISLTNNQAGSGGAIFNLDTTLNVLNSTFSFNSTTAVLGEGGAIYSQSATPLTDTISKSTFNNNTAYNGGAIYNYTQLTLNVDDSTFLANTASNAAGAILSNGTAVNVTNSTFYNNHASSNKGYTFYNGTSLSLKNSIVALPSSPPTPQGYSCGGSGIISNGGNLQWPAATCNSASPALTSADPKINSNLGLNGGPTQTLALLAGSPAINAAIGCPAFDQRYASRLGNCDSGAYEYGGVAPGLPGVTLGFNPASVAVGTNSQIVLTLHNPAALPMTNIAFSIPLSQSLQIATNPDVQNNCSTPGTLTALAGARVLDMYSLALNSGETCTVKINLIGTKSGNYLITTGFVFAAETGLGPSSNTASLNVTPGSPALVAVKNGSGQSTGINTAFSNSLQAIVTDSFGNPVGGVDVNFLAPSSGASAIFPNSTNNYNTISDATGQVSVAITANTTGGSYTVVASAVGATPANFNLQNLTCDNPNQVLADSEDGSGTGCGTLSFALTHASPNSAISFGPQITKIKITGVLPAPVASNLSIQGYCDYDPATNHGIPQVILEGQSVNGPGLRLTGGMSILGLAITGFTGPDGFALDITGDNNTVVCSWLGTDNGINSPRANTGGIRLAGNNNHIGTSNPLSGNLISGNNGSAILVNSGTGHTVYNNWIGVTKDGVSPLKNTSGGIQIMMGGQLHFGPGNRVKS